MNYNVGDMPRDVAGRIWPTVIGPRPVFLVVTESEEGISNIAPFSSISCVSSYPPVVCMSFGLRKGEPKHTQLNIMASCRFSLNAVSRRMAAIANESSAGNEIQDDFQRLGLTRRVFSHSAVAGIAESPASISCEVTQSVPIEGTKCLLVLAKCMEVIIDDQFLTAGVLDPVASNLISTIGVEEYISVKGESFHLPRLWE
jgi:flavin reductase (DIM6/NTAB) family NADH-FMN oxidoreductase RutF